jgi:hypothetical protein
VNVVLHLVQHFDGLNTEPLLLLCPEVVEFFDEEFFVFVILLKGDALCVELIDHVFDL